MANRKVPSTYERCKGVLCEGCGEKSAAARGLCLSCYAKSKERLTWADDPPTIIGHRRKLALRPCPVCGEQFRPRGSDRATVCSRECGWVWQGHKAKLISTGGRVSVVALRGPCAMCGKPFTKEHQAAFCSDECRRESAIARERAAYVCRTFDCAECGKRVTTEYGNKAKRFCGRKCAGRNARRNRRCKERALRRLLKANTVDPTKVFERDGWRCQLCGAKTLKSKRGTYHDKAPELDHIVPLSQGGDHSYRNTQCAHRACNAAKSNGAGGQLLLFGMVG